MPAIRLLGNHLVKSWSSTQAIIALSSGEAEFYALVKCGSVALGIRIMLAALGINLKIRISTDASAAKGITARRGAGKIRHIEVSQLWIQDKVRSGQTIMRKVDTKENLADALTKFVSAEELRYHLANTGQLVVQGRHELAPESTDLNYVGSASESVGNCISIKSCSYAPYAFRSSRNYIACNYLDWNS